MLRISKLADYGIILMNYLAQHPTQSYSAAALASITHISAPVVSKILKQLNKASLLVSERGPSGGYQLMRDPQQINLTDIISAIDGEVALTQCAQGDNVCVLDECCQLKSNWRVINNVIFQVLSKISLVDMSKRLQPSDIPINFQDIR